MNNKSLLRIGIIGAVTSALCCFTPLLVVLFGTLGLTAFVGYIDYVVLPLLVVFVLLVIVSLYRLQKGKN